MVRDGKALVGANVLGKLLMELRARAVLNPSDVRIVRVPAVPNLLFLGKPMTDFPLP